MCNYASHHCEIAGQSHPVPAFLFFMIQPYDYQQEILSQLETGLQTKQRLLTQLMTSGGKTVIFSFFIKSWFENHNSNVLILAHRIELISQAENELSGIGIGSEPIYAKTKPLHHSRVYISMIETGYRRLQKNPFFFKNIGLIITDEAHILSFHKVYDFFPLAKITAFTATPCVMKKVTFWKCIYCRTEYKEETECCDTITEEWSKPFTLSQIYEDIIVGPNAEKLIQIGSIVREISFIKHYTDDSNLKTDADGEFTTESAEKEYGSDNAAFNVLLNYQELCEGKKTLIFNPSASANKKVYEKFIAAGYTNVRMFDSVNKEESGDRADLLKWFASNQDAILLNVAIFTTGFNSREVEAIILNRPIGSLGLYLQIGGRGMRSSLKIFKDGFIFIDGGGNIDRFGELSSPRDWKKIFFQGTSKPKAKKQDAVNIQTCPECSALYAKLEPFCPECGYEIPIPERKEAPDAKESNEVLVPIRKVPPPSPQKIYEYTVKMGEDLNFAWRILINYIVDLFKYYRVSKDLFNRTVENGKFEQKILKLITPSYFMLKGKPDLKSGVQRTRAYFVNSIKTKLQERYEKTK